MSSNVQISRKKYRVIYLWFEITITTYSYRNYYFIENNLSIFQFTTLSKNYLISETLIQHILNICSYRCLLMNQKTFEAKQLMLYKEKEMVQNLEKNLFKNLLFLNWTSKPTITLISQVCDTKWFFQPAWQLTKSFHGVTKNLKWSKIQITLNQVKGQWSW